MKILVTDLTMQGKESVKDPRVLGRERRDAKGGRIKELRCEFKRMVWISGHDG
jgi:hypothetical protein